jgi:hypothetical protein
MIQFKVGDIVTPVAYEKIKWYDNNRRPKKASIKYGHLYTIKHVNERPRGGCSVMTEPSTTECWGCRWKLYKRIKIKTRMVML